MCLLSGEVKYRSQRLNLNPSQRKQTVALSSDKMDIVFSTEYCFLPVRQSLRRITTPNTRCNDSNVYEDGSMGKELALQE